MEKRAAFGGHVDTDAETYMNYKIHSAGMCIWPTTNTDPRVPQMDRVTSGTVILVSVHAHIETP